MRNWYRTTIGGLPAAYWYLWSGLLINRLGGFVVLYLSLYLTGPRGFGTALAGLVVGAYGVGGAAGTLLGGVLTDTWGRRPTLLWAHVAAAASLVGLAFTTEAWMIAALAAVLGLSHAAPGPAFVAAIIDVVPADDRTRAFNLQFWAFNLGLAAASLVGGLLANVGFALLFGVDAAMTLVTAAIIFFRVRETRPATRVREGGLRTPLTDRHYLVFVGLTLLLAILGTQTSTMMPLSMRADGLSTAAYGVIAAYAGAMIVAGQLFVPRLIDRRRKATVLAAANTFLAIGYALIAGVDGMLGYFVAATIFTVGQMLAAPPNAAVIAELSPAALRGRYQGVFFLTFPIAAFVAPTLGGISLQELGDWHWMLCGVLGLCAAIGHLAAGPSRERRVARSAIPASVGGLDLRRSCDA